MSEKSLKMALLDILELHGNPIHEYIPWVDPITLMLAVDNGDLWCRVCGSVDDCPVSWPCPTTKIVLSAIRQKEDAFDQNNIGIRREKFPNEE